MRILTEKLENGITRALDMYPAYDKRSPEPSKNYGIHGMDLIFSVKRESIAVTWRLFSNWHLPHVRKEAEEKWSRFMLLADGLGSIDYHSPTPAYPDHYKIEKCEYTNGVCYGDGSGLASYKLFDKMLLAPEEIWKTLEEWLVRMEGEVEEEKANQRNFS